MARISSSPAADDAGHDLTAAQVADAFRVIARSSRALIRQARARYTTDVLKWRHRQSFDAIWQNVDWIPGWFHEGSAVVIYELMRGRPPQTVVEIGSYLGRSTVFFALALRELNPLGRVVAIDPHTGDRQQLEGLSIDRLATFELFREHCRAAGVETLVEPRVAHSLEVSADWSGGVDLLYIDGWHSYDAVIADGEAWLPHLSREGVVIFDDYAAYDEVRRAIDDLAGRGCFRLWGAVFGQAVGGLAAEPPASLRRALLFSRGGLRHSAG
jgi:predicted O-methyltransferase YrrM